MTSNDSYAHIYIRIILLSTQVKNAHIEMPI